MRASQAFKASGMSPERLKSLGYRAQLPSALTRLRAETEGWGDFSVEHVLLMKLMVEVHGALDLDATKGWALRPSAVAPLIDNALALLAADARTVDALRGAEDDIWIGAAILEAPTEASAVERPRPVPFAGPLEHLGVWRDDLLARADRALGPSCEPELPRLLVVNASAAARHVHRRAVEIGAIEEG